MKTRMMVLALPLILGCHEGMVTESAVGIDSRANKSFYGFVVIGPYTIQQNEETTWSLCFCQGAEPYDPNQHNVKWYIGNESQPVHTGLTITLQPGDNFALTARHWTNSGQLIAVSTQYVTVEGTSLDDACVPGGSPYCYTDLSSYPGGVRQNDLCHFDAASSMPDESIVRWYVDGALKQTGWLSSGAAGFAHAHSSNSSFDLRVTVEHASIAATYAMRNVPVGSEYVCGE